MVGFLKLVAKLTGEKAFWAWANKEKVIEWMGHGFSFKWIERQIIRALAGK
ncbi:aureocin A53 family class IId bacteriocin [Bacillus safensis]|uniref:aureocin A53 family class IId bacteriocin n=1 Tax=Bacillus safensis TaxID=561879 RepID=UPI0036E3391A